MAEIKKNLSNLKGARAWSKLVALVLSVLLIGSTAIIAGANSLKNPTTAQAESGISLSAASDTDGGEVRAGDVITYFLRAEFNSEFGTKSGIVTFTDVLPQYTTLVGNPEIVNNDKTSNTSQGYWQKSKKTSGEGTRGYDVNSDYTYNDTSRELKIYINNMNGAGDNQAGVIEIQVKARVTDDTRSLPNQENNTIYYKNTATIKYAKASKTTNPVYHYSKGSNVPYDNVNKFNIVYSYAGVDFAGRPNVPSDPISYEKGNRVDLAPIQSATGYTFSGWHLVNTDTSKVRIDVAANQVIVDADFSGNTVYVEGTWSGDGSQGKTQFSYQTKWSGIDGDDWDVYSSKDLPETYKNDAGVSTNLDQDTPIPYPKNPEDYDKSLYTFKGYKIKITYSGATSPVDISDILETQKGNEILTLPTGPDNSVIVNVTVIGYFERNSFSVTFQKGTNWPSSASLPSNIKQLKWGEPFYVYLYNNVGEGYFTGWTVNPSGATEPAYDDETKYIMPACNIVLTGNFDRAFKLTVKNGTADGNKTELKLREGDFVDVTPNELVDLDYTGWTYDDATSAGNDASRLKNWQEDAEGNASFNMPARDITLQANAGLEISFKVSNGWWSSGDKYAFYTLPMKSTDAGTWQGTLSNDDVNDAVGGINNAVCGAAYDADSGHWEGRDKDDDYKDELPVTYTQDDYYVASADGRLSADCVTYFNYVFDTDRVTVKFSVQDCQREDVFHSTHGKVAWVQNEGDVPSEWLDDVQSEEIEAIYDENEFAAGIAYAKPNDGFHLKMWTKEEIPWISFAGETVEWNKEHPDAPNRFVPQPEWSEDTEAYIWYGGTYLAVFEGNPYTIHFDGNGATSGETKDQSMIFDSPAKLSGNGFKKDGYVFAGWNSEKDGSGYKYAPGQNVTDLATSGQFTLYAQWRQASSGEDETDANYKTYAYANDIHISLAKANEFISKSQTGMKDCAVTWANAFAFIKNDEDITTEDVSFGFVDVESLESCVEKNGSLKIGEYPITLTTQDDEASVTFTMHITDGATEPTVVDKLSEATLVANDFMVSSSQVEALSLDGLPQDLNENNKDGLEKLIGTSYGKDGKGISFAKAWKTDDVNVTYRLVVAENSIKKAKGTYTISFAAIDNDSEQRIKDVTGRELIVTSKVTVFDRSSVDGNTIVDPDSSTTVNDSYREVEAFANDFTLGINEVREGGLSGDGRLVANSAVYNRLMELANTKVQYTTDYSKVRKIEKVYNWIKAEKGTYVVKFLTEADEHGKSATVLVNCTVKDKSGTWIDPATNEEYRISANDVIVSTIEAKLNDLDHWVSASKAEAMKTSSVSGECEVPISSYTRKPGFSIDEVRAGIYEEAITLSTNIDPTGVGAEVTIGAEVFDIVNSDDPDPAKATVKQGANNVNVSTQEVRDLGLNEPAEKMSNDAKTYLLSHSQAKAVAWNTTTLQAIQPTVKGSTIEDERGTYTVTFEAENTVNNVKHTAQSTVKVRVSDNHKTSEAGNVEITAKNISLFVDEVKSNKLTTSAGNAKLIELAEALGYKMKDGSQLDADHLKVTANNLKEERGRYAIEFTAINPDDEKETVSVEIVANVYNRGSVDEKNNERITANNFIVQKDEIANLTKQDWVDIARAQAEAVKSVEGKKDAISVTKATRQGNFAGDEVAIGSYDNAVKFATEAGTSVQVAAKVFEQVGRDADTWNESSVSIGANNFTLSADIVKKNGLNRSGSELSASAKEYLVKHAQSFAINVEDYTEVATTVSECNITDNKGTYAVTFEATGASGEKAYVTVDAQIVGSGAEAGNDPTGKSDADKTGQIFLSANDIFLTVTQVREGELAGNEQGQVSAAGEQNLIGVALAKAYRLVDGSAVDVKVKSSGIKNVRGSYFVTFTATNPDDESASVDVSVVAKVVDRSSADVSRNEVISANNIYVSRDDVAEMTDAQWMAMANATAEKMVSISGESDAVELVSAKRVNEFAGDAVAVGYYASAIEFATNKGTTITIGAQVFDETGTDVEFTPGDGNHSDEVGDFSRVNVYVGANRAQIPLSVVSELGLDKGTNLSQEAQDYLIERMQAQGMRTSDGASIKPTVTATIRKVNGTATVTFTVKDDAGHSASALVQIRVLSSSTQSEGKGTTYKEDDETYRTNQILLSANNIITSMNNVAEDQIGIDAEGNTSEIGVANLIKQAEAKATKVWDGSQVDVQVVSSNVKAKRGTFYVTFTATNPDDPTEVATIKISVKVMVYGSRSTSAVPSTVSLFGNDASIEDGDVVPPEVEVNGNIQVFTNPVYVTREDANKWKNFNILEEEKYDESGFGNIWIKLSGAWAHDSTKDVQVEYPPITAIKALGEFADDCSSEGGIKVGIYEGALQFSTEDGTTGITDVIVTDKWGADITVDGTEGQSWEDVQMQVGGNDFWVPSSVVEKEGLNEDANKLEDKAKAFILEQTQAWGVDLTNGSDTSSKTGDEYKPTIEVTDCKILSEKGTYTVTLKATSTDKSIPSASCTLNVRVSDEGEETDGVVIRANNIRVSIDDVSTQELDKNSSASMTDKGFENLKRLCDVDASRLIDGRELKVEPRVNNIKAERGKYDVTFSAKDSADSSREAFVTVTVQVLEHGEEEETNNERITANNLIVKKDIVQQLSDQDWINIASVSAEKVKSVVGEPDNVKVTKAEKLSGFDSAAVAVGTYDNAMTFATNKGTSVTVGAQVFDQTASDSSETGSAKVYVAANNFQLSEAEVEQLGLNKNAKELSDTAKSYLVKHAQARGVDCYGFSEVTPEVTVCNVSGDKGTYTVQFTAKSSDGAEAACTVNARVSNEGAESADEASKVLIHANDVHVSVDEVKTKKLAVEEGQATLIALAEAHGVKLADGTLIQPELDSTTLKAERGVYDVKFKVTNPADASKVATVAVKVIVSDWGSESVDANEKLTANDMFVSKDEASKFDPQGWAEASGAFAQKIVTAVDEADEVEIAKAIKNGEFADDPEAIGYYDDAITLVTDKDTAVKLDVQVLDHVAYDADKSNVKIAANEFVLSKAWVEEYKLNQTLSSMGEDEIEMLKDLAHVRAIDLTDFTNVDVKVTASTLKAVKGGYELTLQATSHDGAHTATLKLPVRVSDNGEQSSTLGVDAEPNGDILLNTNNITVSKDEVAEHGLVADADGVTSDDAQTWLINTTLAKATDIDYGEDVEVSVKSNEIAEDNGNYKVVFTSTNPDDETEVVETETNVKVVDFAVVDYDKGVRICGHKARMAVAEADKILMGQIEQSALLVRVAHADAGLNEGEKELVRLAGVYAESTEDGTELKISSIDKGVKAALGDYATTFSVGGVSLTIPNVNVSSNSTEDANIQTRMTANDVELTSDEAGELLSKSNDEIATELALKANVFAFSTDTGKEVTVETAEWNVENKEGTYQATFHTDNDATITTQVSVQQPTSVVQTGDVTFWIVLVFMALAGVSYTVMRVSKHRRQRNDGAEKGYASKLKGQF